MGSFAARLSKRLPGSMAVLCGVLACFLVGCGKPLNAQIVREEVPPVLSRAVARSAIAPSSVGDDFIPYALNALLVPLLDDDVPSRWADPSISLDCDDARVTIDGQRPDVGAPVPRSFTVRWSMDRCTPFGADVELSGEVELSVEKAKNVYMAHVRPRALRVSTSYGVQTLTETFTARLAVEEETP